MKQVFKLFIIFCVVFIFAACSGSTKSFTWHVETVPNNLDPQITTGADNLSACTNLYSGLVRIDADGNIQTDIAESYTVSDNGLVYTFTLRNDTVYRIKDDISDEYILTANDFVFAFKRIFSKETNSPYTAMFSSINNSLAVLDGSMSPSNLGVTALDTHTLEITLSQADDFFLQALAHPAAAPCNEEFFVDSGGTYGLNKNTILSSGPFYYYNWTDSGLFLRRASDGNSVDYLRFITHTTTDNPTAEELILADETSAAIDTTFNSTSLLSIDFSDTTWSLIYNTQTILENEALRKAISAVATNIQLPTFNIYENDVTGILPSTLPIDGEIYRTDVGTQMPTFSLASDYHAQALSELSISDLQEITILAPTNSQIETYISAINSALQKELSLFFSVEFVDDETYKERLANNEYTIAIAPISYDTSDAVSFLAQFSEQLNSAEYNTLLIKAQGQTGSEKRQSIASAENILLESCIITPLFYQKSRLLINPTFSDIVYDPFSGILDLSFAHKMD